jgi:hypothetical protein
MSDLTPPGALQLVPGTPGPASLDTVTQGLLVPVQTDQRFRHFPSEIYTLTPHSNLVRFLRVLLGDAGAGQLRKRLVLSRLGQIMSSSYFYDLDSFYGALFGMQRAPAEALSMDPYSDTASPDDWTSAATADASYRNRLFQFGRALEYGPSPVGMKLVAEAILSVTCDIYESYIYADQLALTYGGLQAYTYAGLQQFTYAQLEGVTGTVPNSLQRKQFVIAPHRPITQVEANDVLQVIEQLKPADAVATIAAQGPDVYQPVKAIAVWADSVYWEIRPAVTVTTTGATVPYGQAQPGTTISPAVPPFNSYQGEQWFYNKDIVGAISYLQDPMQNVLSSTDTQRIFWSDGTYTDFLPTNAPLPWWMALLGRYAQDGVMAINPLSGRGSLANNASASLSDITFDGVDMDTLLQTISQQNTTNNNFQLSSDSTSFWCTDNRAQTDPSRDILEVRFGSEHTVNAVSLDVAHFPSHISVEYYDDAAGTWYSMLQHDIVDSVPGVLVNNDDYLLTKIHPQHYGEDHWYSLSTRILPTNTQRVRVVLTRRTGKAPAYNRITTQPGPSGGFATIQVAAAYSLAVRRLKIGYSVEGTADLPIPYLPNGGVIDAATDIMGSPVQYSMYREGASGLLGVMGTAQPVQWRCSPQPLASSVVSFYMDVRTPAGTAQVVDRFLIDPTHLGVHATLYWSNSTPSPANTHTARDIPLIYPASIINGNIVPAANGVQFPNAGGTTGDIDVSNTGLQFDPTQDWWVGLSFFAAMAPTHGSLPFIDVRGVKIGYAAGAFYINPTTLLSTVDAGFEDGTIGDWGGAYACTLSNTTAHAVTGTHSLRATTTAVGEPYFTNNVFLPVTPGVSYAATGWVTGSNAADYAILGYAWYDRNHTYMSQVSGPAVSITPSIWTQVNVTATAPTGAAFVQLFPNMLNQSVGDTFDWDAFSIIGSSLRTVVPIPLNSLIYLVVGFTHATNTWSFSYQINAAGDPELNVPVTVTGLQPAGMIVTSYPNVRVGGYNDNSIPATSGMLLQNLVLKGETLTSATIASYLTDPESYSVKGSFNSQDQGFTRNAYLRFDDTFISEANPSGMVGGAPTFYPDLFWTPIAGDYLLTTGYISLPPTLAKFWKIELTNLAPEPYEGFLPVQSTVKTFPATVMNASMPGTATPGYEGPMDVGLPTLIALGQGENTYPYTGTIGTPTPTGASNLLMSPTQVMISKDPGTAQQIGAASWLYNFTNFHQGMQAPRFATPGFHNYQTSDVPFTSKLAFFCGFKTIQAVRTSPLAQNDAPVYYEAFLDEVFIESNTFNQNPGDLATPTNPADSGLLPCTAQSVSFISTHDVTSLQFATSQSDAVQVVYDDDMRNTALASTTWNDTGTWHVVGDVAPIQVTYLAGSNAIVFSRQSNPPPPAQNVTGAVHGMMNPPIEPPLKTENLAQSHAATANIPFGGICSAPLLLSARGRAWVAVRYTPITPLTNPLWVQLVDVATGRLVWQAETSGSAGAVTEFTAPYDIGSVPGVNVADSLYVQLVQQGKSNDAISIDTLSVFDESIVWEFSVDGGTTFWQAIDSRNNPNGVLRFPVASQQLVWRTTCYRESMHISSLQIRPIYEGQLNVDTQPFMRGPNLSTFDTTPDVYNDPMFTQWNNPVPRWWYLAFKQYPNLFPDGVPIINVFSNFYNRTTTDDLSTTLVDTATRIVTAEPSAFEFFGPVTDAGTWVSGLFHRPAIEDVSGTFGDSASFFVVTPAEYDNIISPTITKLIT